MKLFNYLLLITWGWGCHADCKDGYGRASDDLCYPLGEPSCGEGRGRDDEGECRPFTTSETDTGINTDADADTDADTDADADADTDADTDADADPIADTTGFEGHISMGDGSEMSAGENIVIIAWAAEDTDPETGLALDGASPLQVENVSVLDQSLNIIYLFTLEAFSEPELDLRVTAHKAEGISSIEGAPTGTAPSDPSASLTLSSGTWIEGVNIVLISD
jgi:hypothetical protein